MTTRKFLRVAASFILASLLAACHGGGHLIPSSDQAVAVPPAQQVQQGSGGIQTMSLTQPAPSSFAPSSWGRIATFQIFDETNNGTITASAATAHGYRYDAVWGVRPGMGPAWRAGNAGLKASYYFIGVTDASTSSWGGIGHSLTWWKANHPSWVLYACTSNGAPTHTPASVVGLPNVPLDIHNTAIASYLVNLVAKYAIARGYNALAADEITYWFAGSGGPGYYPCGVWSGNTFIRRYTQASGGGVTYMNDMVNWVKAMHSILRTSYPTLKLIVNHPSTGLSSYEETLLSNVDGDLDESGFTYYGLINKLTPTNFASKVAWMRYAQQHGVAVLMNQDWGSTSMGAAQRDYSLATYLMGNEQSAAAFISPHTGYGVETYWRPEYATSLGAPCGEYYTGGGLFYRRFPNAFVVANVSTSSLRASLPAGHTFSDLEGRSKPTYIAPHDGYVLRTTNGCN